MRTLTLACFNSLQVAYKPRNSSLSTTIMSVSIPYRQPTNSLRPIRTNIHPSKFQFLIGSLQTQSIGTLDECETWFQFLIGSLQTLGRIEIYEIFVQFQFLIGSLQTSRKMPLKLLSPSCFNSLQVAYKPYEKHGAPLPDHMFQFLIGSLQT